MILPRFWSVSLEVWITSTALNLWLRALGSLGTIGEATHPHLCLFLSRTPEPWCHPPLAKLSHKMGSFCKTGSARSPLPLLKPDPQNGFVLEKSGGGPAPSPLSLLEPNAWALGIVRGDEFYPGGLQGRLNFPKHFCGSA